MDLGSELDQVIGSLDLGHANAFQQVLTDTNQLELCGAGAVSRGNAVDGAVHCAAFQPAHGDDLQHILAVGLDQLVQRLSLMLVNESGQVSQAVPVQVDLVACGQHDLLLGPVLVPGQPDHFDLQADVFLNLCCEFVFQEFLETRGLFAGVQDGDLTCITVSCGLCIRSRCLCAAGCHGQDHDQSQNQSKDALESVLHFVSSLVIGYHFPISYGD